MKLTKTQRQMGIGSMSRNNVVIRLVAYLVLFSTLSVGLSFVGDNDSKVSAQGACPQIPTAGGVFPTAPYTNTELECMLRNGQNSAIDWDRLRTATPSRQVDDCRSAFLQNAALYGGNIREMINGEDSVTGVNSPYGGCGYTTQTWLSERYIPNTSVPISRPYGTNTLQLQINYVKFINGPLVAPDYNGVGGWSAIYNDLSRWSSTLNGANDTAPNAIGTGGQKPAHIESRSYIEGLTVSGTFPGMTVSGGAGTALSGNRNANPGSRFWFARTPPVVNVTIPGGITGNGTIYVDMDYKTMVGVWKGGGGASNYLTHCAPTLGTAADTWGSTVNFANIRQCDDRTTRLTIQVVLTNDFNLTPNIAPLSPTSQAGDNIVAQGSITKSGPTPSYSDTVSRVTRLTYNPGSAPQAGANSNSDPCGYFTASGRTSCSTVLTRNGAITGTTPLTPNPSEVAAGTIGSRVCYAVSVTRQDYTGNPAWGHIISCTIIASSPRMSIVGGDAASGGGIISAGACGTTTGGFIGSNKMPGSFGEYGLLVSPGTMSYFGSAGQTNGQTLSFANNPVGSYDSNRCVANLEPRLTNNVTFGAFAGGAVPGTGSWRASGDITISASTLSGAGQRLIVADPGRTVTISGNLTYAAGPYARYADVPSLVIIADTIRINSNVTQVDGLFIARGNMTTCSEAGSSKSNVQGSGLVQIGAGGVCRANRLQVNGAIIANGELVTARTIGGESAGIPPAEIYTFRPEVFLGPIERGASDAALKTDLETELPPRN